jgi:PAS domain S-box-containing protein
MLARSAAIAVRSEELVERVERSEREYRRLHDQAADAILVTDPNGAILDANDEAAAMFGFATGELRDMSVYELFGDSEDRRTRTDELQRTSALSGERTHRRRDGTGSQSSTRHAAARRRAPARRCATSPSVWRTGAAAHEPHGAHGRSSTRSARSRPRARQRRGDERDRRACAAPRKADGAMVAVLDGDGWSGRFASGIATEHVGLRQAADRSPRRPRCPPGHDGLDERRRGRTTHRQGLRRDRRDAIVDLRAARA